MVFSVSVSAYVVGDSFSLLLSGGFGAVGRGCQVGSGWVVSVFSVVFSVVAECSRAARFSGVRFVASRKVFFSSMKM